MLALGVRVHLEASRRRIHAGLAQPPHVGRTGNGRSLERESTKPMIPGRDGRDDTLKAAAIFGVVLLHTPGAAGEYVHAFRFCVPAFVTLWAMHFEQGLMRQPDGRRSAYARRRLGRLMVPYLFWTTMYMAVFHGQIEDWQNTPIPHDHWRLAARLWLVGDSTTLSFYSSSPS